MPRSRNSRRKVAVVEDDADDDDDSILEMSGDNETRSRYSQDEDEDDDAAILFSSQAPEMTQDILPVRAADRNNLLSLDKTARATAISALARLILFKGLAGEPIDRTKCIKEAGIQDKRISSAAFEEAARYLQSTFDFSLRRMPAWMERIKNFPGKFKDRYYLINTCQEDTTGSHSKALHAVHETNSIEKGFLMVVLALCYCKGEPRHDGSRWILDQDLYQLLHQTDENIPAAPPGGGKHRASMSPSQSGGGVSLTPDVDFLLRKFVQRDYLVQQKASEFNSNDDTQSQQMEDTTAVYYTMGPRAAMEIGRRQVLYFCAEIMDQEPDPTMLLELQHDEAAAAEMEE